MSEWSTHQIDGIASLPQDRVEVLDQGIVKPDVTPALMDLTDLYDERLHYAPQFCSTQFEGSTPLSQEMIQWLAVTNRPMTVAHFMKQALTHPVHGYYTNPTTTTEHDIDDDDEDDWDNDKNDLDGTAHDVIGKRGDFVTAPEISQVFGECLAIWFVSFLETQKQKQQQLVDDNNHKMIRLVEIGPGKGTLMADMVRTFQSSFPKYKVDQVHFIEQSPAMKREQEKALLPMMMNEQALSWHDSFMDFVVNDRKRQEKDDNNEKTKIPTLVICQEFIDALPIHVFEHTKDGWRERLVDIAETKDTKDTDSQQQEQQQQGVKKTRLRFVTSPDTTPALRTLLNVDQQQQPQADDDDVAVVPVGQVVEVCPEGILLVQDIAKYLEQQRGGGACLVVDYGQEGSTDSLRGFSKHKQVNVLSRPGEVDVTADVDFAALKHAVNHCQTKKEQTKSHSARAFGPVTQGQFLASMGIVERVSQLIDLDETTDKQAHDLYTALERLVLPDQMGERYKVLSIVCGDNDDYETPVPAGFENVK